MMTMMLGLFTYWFLIAGNGNGLSGFIELETESRKRNSPTASVQPFACA